MDPSGLPNYKHLVHAASVGHLALDVLQHNDHGKVIGSTSRGFFILAPDQRVLFVSYESVPGPFSINIIENLLNPSRIVQGMRATLKTDRLVLTGVNIHIHLDTARLWYAPEPPEQTQTWEDIDRRLRELSAMIIEKKRGIGLVSLLPFILDLPARPTVPLSLQPAIAMVLLQTGNLFKQSPAQATAALEVLFGLGSGLTPSGDDFIAGMLLALNRMPERQALQDFLEELNERLTALAFAKTTALSASIIQAACAGSADERLLTAIDGLLSGRTGLDTIFASLESFGNSSGMDAFCGMVFALEASHRGEAHP